MEIELNNLEKLGLGDKLLEGTIIFKDKNIIESVREGIPKEKTYFRVKHEVNYEKGLVKEISSNPITQNLYDKLMIKVKGLNGSEEDIIEGVFN